MSPDPSEAQRLRDEVQRLRQLLQAGVALASSVLDGDDVDEELRGWIAAATTAPPD